MLGASCNQVLKERFLLMSSLRPSPPADVSSSPPTSLSAPLPTVPEVSVATEPGVFFRRNVDVSVEEETSVRWVTPPMKQAHANGVNVAMCGVGPSPGRTVGDHGLMVTIISEDADHPPVTHRIPRGGGCLENLFNQPGCYTYYVSSGPVVTGRIVAKAPGPQYRSGKPSATAKKIMEAKHGQKSEIEGSLTRAHEREEAVDRCVVPQAALVGPKNCFSSLLQSEIASQWISVINETMAVGGSEICANEAEQVFGTASAVEERYATRVDDVDVAGTDDMVGMSRGKYEGDTLLEARTASIPSPFLSHVPTPPCFEDLSTLEPTSSEGESGWPKDSKVCLDDTDKVIGLLGRGHNGDGPSAPLRCLLTSAIHRQETDHAHPLSDKARAEFQARADSEDKALIEPDAGDALRSAFFIDSPRKARAASSSPRDLQILFGNYVSDADAATQVAAETPSVSSSDDQVPFPAAPVGGERGVSTDPLAPWKGTSGWTSLVDDESDDQRKPRWGNCSTKVSLAERQRRSEQFKGVYLPPEDEGRAPSGTRLAAFPEASRQPRGGYWVPEDPEDTLPPPSAFEIEATALMMKRYNNIIERLRKTGCDEELPNGYTPKIYDLTGGPGR